MLSPDLKKNQFLEQKEKSKTAMWELTGGASKRPMAPTRRKTSKQTSAGAATKKPLTRAQFNQRLIAAGLITRLPDPSLDVDDDDPDDQPVSIKGEPLSETIIRERRSGGWCRERPYVGWRASRARQGSELSQ
jgi:hypothetical protein